MKKVYKRFLQDYNMSTKESKFAANGIRPLLEKIFFYLICSIVLRGKYSRTIHHSLLNTIEKKMKSASYSLAYRLAHSL